MAECAGAGSLACDPAGDGFDIAKPVDQAECKRAVAEHEAAVEYRRLFAFQPVTATLSHPGLEPLVQIVEQVSDELYIFRAFWAERIKSRLVASGGVEPSLDTEELILTYVTRVLGEKGSNPHTKRDVDRQLPRRVRIESFLR